jgi:hypothetical protein
VSQPEGFANTGDVFCYCVFDRTSAVSGAVTSPVGPFRLCLLSRRRTTAHSSCTRFVAPFDEAERHPERTKHSQVHVRVQPFVALRFATLSVMQLRSALALLRRVAGPRAGLATSGCKDLKFLDSLKRIEAHAEFRRTEGRASASARHNWFKFA